MKRILCLIFLSTMLMNIGCNKNSDKTTIDYYITTTNSTTIEFLSFSLLNVRAYRNNTNRTIYIDPVDLFFTTNPNEQPDTVYLGSSEIEHGIVDAYDYWITNGQCSINGSIINLIDKENHESNTTHTQISIAEGEAIKVIFTLDTDESIIMTPNRDFKLLPKIRVATK
ncbi:MAG: hypothetical protein KF852_13905 [Saprospiraceae bacterium]|nr:hypothetical protein [Saprospiraceae bacterium]